jgi:hypothetical protein
MTLPKHKSRYEPLDPSDPKVRQSMLNLLIHKYQMKVGLKYDWTIDQMEEAFPLIESAANGTNQNPFDYLKYSEQIEMYKDMFHRRSNKNHQKI